MCRLREAHDTQEKIEDGINENKREHESYRARKQHKRQNLRAQLRKKKQNVQLKRISAMKMQTLNKVSSSHSASAEKIIKQIDQTFSAQMNIASILFSASWIAR